MDQSARKQRRLTVGTNGTEFSHSLEGLRGILQLGSQNCFREACASRRQIETLGRRGPTLIGGVAMLGNSSFKNCLLAIGIATRL